MSSLTVKFPDREDAAIIGALCAAAGLPEEDHSLASAEEFLASYVRITVANVTEAVVAAADRAVADTRQEAKRAELAQAVRADTVRADTGK